VTITVNRTDGTDCDVAVDYQTANGTATAGSDYAATSGTLTVPAGQASATFTVTITNDTSDEPDETFTVTLSNPGGGATLGAQTSATVTILDDDFPFGPPPNVAATAVSTTDVLVSWSPVDGATTYEVYRAASVGDAYGLAGTTAGTSIDIGGHTLATSYLFKVRAMNGGTPSAFTGVDAATTVIFTDTSLGGVTVKAVHITEIQTAVNALRTAAGLTPASFASVTAGTTILESHITELRTAVDAARTAIGLAAISYTDPSLSGAVIKGAHITDLRGGVQ
jgi:hypothetical protein